MGRPAPGVHRGRVEDMGNSGSLLIAASVGDRAPPYECRCHSNIARGAVARTAAAAPRAQGCRLRRRRAPAARCAARRRQLAPASAGRSLPTASAAAAKVRTRCPLRERVGRGRARNLWTQCELQVCRSAPPFSCCVQDGAFIFQLFTLQYLILFFSLNYGRSEIGAARKQP